MRPLTFGVLLRQQSASPPYDTAGSFPSSQSPSGLDPGFTLVSNQAEIESISSSETVAVWSDPGNNSTVIWTSSDMSEGMP